MRKVKANLEIPEDAYLALSSSGYTKKRISSEAKSLLSAHLFERGVLSMGKAAELAELNLGAFILFLDELEIPVIDYDDDELNAEFKIAKKLKEA
jgi:predicted HTH domain antitoxin